MTLAKVRREYRGPVLLESRAPSAPLPLLSRWLRDALRHGFLEPNAMTLATIDTRGKPRARMVLLKEADARGLTFYTNLRSAKARELAGLSLIHISEPTITAPTSHQRSSTIGR